MPLPLAIVELPGAARANGSLTECVAAAHPDHACDHDFSRTVAAFGGAVGRSRLHALHPARPGDEGAMTGFALAVLGHLAALTPRPGTPLGVRPRRPILWVQDRGTRQEAGLPYGLGFHGLGLDLSQFVIVSTRTALDALAAAEIGLEIGGLDGVLAELPRRLPADMLALGKRLALRAERSGVPCLLLHASAAAVPAPVATRWQIAGRTAVVDEVWGAPIPTVDLGLLKNRFGPIGRWPALLRPAPWPALLKTASVGAHHDHSGASNVRVPVAPLSQPLAAVPADRSRAPSARAVAA